jgi:hypothetical protein
MYSLYHSYYLENNKTLYGNHVSGFYSCINEVRNSLYKLIKEKKYPEKISFENTLYWYRDNEDLYPILYKLDVNKIENLKKEDFNIQQFCPTNIIFNSLDFKKIKLIEDVYFLPSDIINKRVCELEKKYNIDYTNILAILHRGTDKGREAKLLPVTDWIEQIKKENDNNYKVLIQTDELFFKNSFLENFKNSFYFEEMIFDNQYVSPKDKKIEWCINFEAIMRIISKCKKIITHSGNCGIIPIIYRSNLDGVSQCFKNGEFINFL